MITIDRNNNISIVQHDNAVLNLKVLNRTLASGDKVLFLAKRSYSQSSYNIEIEVTSFKADGSVDIFISETDTSNDAGKYKYSICIHTKEGAITTVVMGELQILEGVHHG